VIDWLIGEAFNVVTIFGGDPETARGSRVGRIIFSIGKFAVSLIGFVAAVCTVLEFLGFQTPIRNYFHLPS
jgi:hypothetical protein